MKKSIVLAASLLALNLTPVFGQPNPNGTPSSAPVFQQRLKEIVNAANSQPALTKFNLDFPGGTPKELVAAIEKAMGKPLNAIIPDENADTKIPALKMSNVDVPHLFNAVVNMSYKYAPRNFGGGGGFGGQPRDVVSSYGFETRDGEMSDDSIWYFFVYKAPAQQAPPPPEKICRFYSLDPYLNRGFTVDDITTSIQTGWKMAGVTSPPELNYHKETKLLIAYGEPDQLATIENVLRTLPAGAGSSVDMQNMRVEMDKMHSWIGKLRQDVDQLTKTNSMPAALPEEKSGN